MHRGLRWPRGMSGRLALLVGFGRARFSHYVAAGSEKGMSKYQSECIAAISTCRRAASQLGRRHSQISLTLSC